VTDTYEYDAYGNALVTTGSTPNVYLYRGEQYDPDLGLYYLRARYYNPQTGRFMSRDPLDPQLRDRATGVPTDPKYLHKYLYANGDPMNRADPGGRSAILQFLFTTADISAFSAYEIGFGIGLAVKYACYADVLYAVAHWAYNGELGGPLWLDLPCAVVAAGMGP
jgi:RHS repeat-associated protein